MDYMNRNNENVEKENQRVREERFRAKQRIEKEKLKEEGKQEKIRLKEQRKREKQRQKNQIRQLKEENGKNRGFGGWLAAVISLGVVVVALATVLTVNMFTPTESDNLLESSYQKSYFDTVSYVDSIDVTMSKLLNTADATAQQKYLVKLAVDAELCEDNLQQLPIADESKFYTTKIINQIGDYAKYLNEKLIDGESIDDLEHKALKSLYTANLALKDGLQKVNSGMGNDYKFSELLNQEENNVLLKNFNELQNLSVDYPELIYDGPFSDGEKYGRVNGMSQEEISEETAGQIFYNKFSSYGIQSVTSLGKTTEDIPTFNFIASTANSEIFCKISVFGGDVIMFNESGQGETAVYEIDDCVEKASAFIDELGYKNMKAVWATGNGKTAYMNFVYEEDDVIIYSDMIKASVNQQTGRITGIEASSYYANHKERLIKDTEITVSQARKAVSSSIDVLTSRLTVIPKGRNAEKLAYEFMGTSENSTYYVYIDAVTGKQIQMFKVIESTEGELLM